VEVPDEGSTKRPRGRPDNIGHFRDDVGLENFLRIIFERTLGMLPIHSKFVVLHPSEGKITILTSSWCSFAVAHKMRVVHFLTFHKEASVST
jgi:hypothetical protein